MSELPQGWAEVFVRDVAEVNPRKSVDLLPNELVTFVPMTAVSEVSGKIEAPIVRPLREVSKGFTQFAEGDVIFAKITPSMENGKSAVATGLSNRIGFGSTEFHVLRSNGAVMPAYLWRFVRQQKFRDDAKREMSGAVGQQRVPAEFLRTYALPLPPLAEQERIVAKVDNLTARTAQATAELAHIPSLVAQYRSTILELAFSGRLTTDFRSDVEGETAGFPNSWSIQPLGELSEIQVGIQVGKKRNSRHDLVEVPYLRVANVQRGWLELNEVRTISVTLEERDRLLLRKGDVLMNEGGDRDKLGRGWVWDEQIPECIHQNHVFRVRLKPNTLPPNFVSHFANEKGQQYFFEQGTQTTNLASISKHKVSILPVPVPPYDEALEIVRRIEAAFSWLNRICSDHASASRLLPKLEEAILTKAFKGELLPQDRGDTPALKLLEEVRASSNNRQSNVRKRLPRTLTMVEVDEKLEKTVIDVLSETGDWISAQEVFFRCGNRDGAPTEAVERFYAELRDLSLAGKLEIEAETDAGGKKLFDKIRLRSPA